MALAACLVDTNILLRIASRSGSEHPVIDRALAHLAEQGTVLYYTLQNMGRVLERNDKAEVAQRFRVFDDRGRAGD